MCTCTCMIVVIFSQVYNKNTKHMCVWYFWCIYSYEIQFLYAHTCTRTRTHTRTHTRTPLHSRSGVFDWLVGRQENGNWTDDRRFVREFSGMSLRGLAWTAPQGYLLQLMGFGWEYSLSGSLMGFIYFLGSVTKVDEHSTHFRKTFDGHTAYAEYYWGTWIWFVLVISCLSQIVRRMHIWIFSKKEYLGFRPFSTWEKVKYESLNRSLSRGLYEGFMVLFNLVCMCSLVFYSLVVQEDVRNKGMTFFGMFTNVIILTFLQGWSFSLLYLKLMNKWMLRKRIQLNQRSVNSGGIGITVSRPFQSPRSSPRIPDLDNLETAAAIANSEKKPFLGWYGQSSPANISPPLDSRHTGAESPIEQYRPHLQLGTVEPATTSTAVLILWPTIEKWVWVDVFIWLRRVIGLVSLISSVLTVIMCIAALFWNYETRRYLHPNCTYEFNGV